MYQMKFTAEEIKAKANEVKSVMESEKLNLRPQIEALVNADIEALKIELYASHEAVLCAEIEAKYQPIIGIYDSLIENIEENEQGE